MDIPRTAKDFEFVLATTLSNRSSSSPCPLGARLGRRGASLRFDFVSLWPKFKVFDRSWYKIIFSLMGLFLLCNPLGLSAEAANTVEFRVAAYMHQNGKFRKIFGDVNADYQLLGSFAINPCWEIWDEVDYSTSSSKKTCAQSNIKLINGSLGLRYVQCFKANLDGYAGVGVSVGRAELKNRSCCTRETKSKTACGCLAKLGVRYWALNNVFLDVFADYLYQNVHFSQNVQTGGFKTGGGIGVSF